MDSAAIVVDEAYVVSDLHLGGEAPFQIFREGAALAAWIRGLLPPGAAAGVRRALVVNGDFVDFLAERPARHFDGDGAVRKLQRIAADAAFAPVFDALAAFVAVPGHRLAIALGNHDVELALPWVRAALLERLCGADEARLGRIVWALDGEGVLLRIGSATGPRVLCVHGNEVDAWNAVDHEAVRQLARDGLRDRRTDRDYIPNAGSRMVVEVMNDIKQRYPFVDLLKPETQAVIPTLLVLEPKAGAALMALPGIVAKQQGARLRIAAGWLGDDLAAAPPDFLALAPPTPARALPVAAESAARRALADGLLDRAESDFRGGRAAIDVLGRDARGRTLGLRSALWAVARGGDRVDALRAELKELADDRSFLLFNEDATYRDMDARVSTSIDFLVTGHTHLPRAIERLQGRAFYFNTGTWARTFAIRPETLASDAAFRALYDALGAGTIEALDDAAGLQAVRPTLAAFWQDADGVHGELRSVGKAPPYDVAAVPHSRFTRA